MKRNGGYYAGNRYLGSSSNIDIMPIVYLDKEVQLEQTGNKVNSCTEWKIDI